jgi:hypothetical protein
VTTICPAGTGIRCDCQMWTRLACEFNDGSSAGLFFRGLLCVLPPWNFEITNSSLAQVCSQENFTATGWINDPCGNGPLDGESLYTAVLERASEASGPFLTSEEVAVYGGLRFDENNLRILSKTSAVQIPEFIPSKYINYNYFDLLRGKVCVCHPT